MAGSHGIELRFDTDLAGLGDELFYDRRYFTGDRVQRKLKWAFGTRSPFTEHSIWGLLHTVAVYGQSETLHRYPVIVYLSSATVWVHGSRLSTKFVEVSRDIFFSFFQNTEMNTVPGH